MTDHERHWRLTMAIEAREKEFVWDQATTLQFQWGFGVNTNIIGRYMIIHAGAASQYLLLTNGDAWEIAKQIDLNIARVKRMVDEEVCKRLANGGS
jgi:hypothetical protein